jgi:N-acetyl-anhydromuramyl-L-alanine amidase AmpD
MIDGTFRVVGVDQPDMTRDRFTAALVSAGSPIATEADECYNRLTRYPVSIRALLAMATHDSGLCTEGVNVTFNTHNPGNTRTCRIPGVIHVTYGDNSDLYAYKRNGVTIGHDVVTPKGTFVRYFSYADGFEDMAARLVDPQFDYAKAHAQTLDQIIPIYAPQTDSNNPDNYIASVVHIIEGYDMGPDRYKTIDGIPVVWIPAPNGNYGGAHADFRWIIIHDIEGSGQSGINTLTTVGRQASVQFVTDPDNNRIAQLVGCFTEAWGCGNDDGNTKGLQIENPGFAGRPYDPRVVNYCGRLTGVLSRDFGIPLRRITTAQFQAGVPGVLGHGDIQPQHGPPNEWHHDPGNTWPWDTMLSIARNVAGSGSTTVDSGNPFFAITGFGISGGILANYSANGGLSVFGYPRSREFDTIEDGKPLRIQWFQRGRAEWAPGRYPDQHDVTWLLAGDALLFDSMDQITAFRFHMHDPHFVWAFTPQTESEWHAKGHNMPAYSILLGSDA